MVCGHFRARQILSDRVENTVHFGPYWFGIITEKLCRNKSTERPAIAAAKCSL